MPTGYTAALKSLNYDVPRWLSEECVRNFGLLVMLRDENMGLTREQILQKLQEESDRGYYRGRVAELTKAYDQAINRDREQWKKVFDDDVAEIKARNEKWAVEWLDGRNKHQKALNEVIVLKSKAVTEFEKSVLTFAQDQLTEGIKFDFHDGPFNSPVPTDSDAYTKTTINDLYKSLADAKEQFQKETRRNNERLAMYQQWLDFIDRTAPILLV